MAVQVSYPGVYVEEFTPGAPIQGVGTSTAAFLGTALQGPVRRPVRIASWDEFVATFGGFPADGPPSSLARGVYGFFLNGGADCYVVRAGVGSRASAELLRRSSGQPAILVTALAEGPAGNAVTVQVVDGSRLAAHLARAVAPAPGTPPVTGPATGLTVAYAETTIVGMPDPSTLTVSSSHGFHPGDQVRLVQGERTAAAQVRAVSAPDTLRLAGPPTSADPEPPPDFTNGRVRSADLVPGATAIRLAVPAGLALNQALPPGSIVSLSAPASGQRPAVGEVAVVAATGADTVTLAAGLTNRYDIADPAVRPTLASLEFDLIVTDTGSGSSERFEQLSTGARHPRYWGSAVTSRLVELAAAPAAPAAEGGDPRPEVKTQPLTGGAPDDRDTAWGQLSADAPSYLDLLRPYQEIALVAIPGAVAPEAQRAVVDHCESAFDRFAILDARPGLHPDGVLDQFATVRSPAGFAALYYPWITVSEPVGGATGSWPPSGHIAGAYARTDAGRGVHKAPANLSLRGALGVERRLTDSEQGRLNLAGVNALRIFAGQTQPVVWGARTTAGDLDRNWQYVNVRRLFIFLERSIEQGVRWAVFEPNDLRLWQRVKRTIGEFLTQVWRGGALFGGTADEAFYVRVDEALNPPPVRALGQLQIEVGVRPVYPAEFLVLRIGIWQGGAQISEG